MNKKRALELRGSVTLADIVAYRGWLDHVKAAYQKWSSLVKRLESYKSKRGTYKKIMSY